MASDEDTVLAVDVVPGQTGDVPLLVPLLDRTLARGVVVDEVVGDKGFDGDRLREACVDRDVNPNVPLTGRLETGLDAGRRFDQRRRA